MRLHANPWTVSLLVTTWVSALALSSCSDDTPSSATASGGTSSGAGGAAAGSPSASGTTAGASGGASAGSSAGGVVGSAGANAGNGGGGKASGGGGAGGTSGGGGNGGSAGAPRVYTIEGCDGPGAGGAGGAGSGGEGNSGGDANAGGSPAVGAGGAGGAVGAGGAGDGGAGPIPAISASFTVYDFVTDKPVQTCVDRVDDFDITVTGDAPLTVAVNLAPGLSPGSVAWTYDGVALMPHNIFPYTLGPDDNGDFQEPTPPLTAGEHVLTVTVYADADAMGVVLGQATITVTVVEG